MSISEAERAAKWQAYLAAPKFRHVTRELEGELERESYIYSTPAGAVELWRRPESGTVTYSSTGYYGGLEIHSPAKLYDFAPEPTTTRCEHTKTGECWTDGSSLAFDEFEHSFNSPDYIKSALADWHRSHFNNETEENNA